VVRHVRPVLVVSGAVQTGVHYHTAFILLTGRTIGAAGRLRNVKPARHEVLERIHTIARAKYAVGRGISARYAWLCPLRPCRRRKPAKNLRS
jgi:hypothetical protein